MPEKNSQRNSTSADYTPKTNGSVNHCGDSCAGKEIPPDLDTMLERVNGNVTLLSEVVMAFAQDFENNHTRMNQALASKDTAEIARLAHGFKGVLGTMEAKEAHHIARSLEAAARENRLDDASKLFHSLMDHITKMINYFKQEHPDYQKQNSEQDD